MLESDHISPRFYYTERALFPRVKRRWHFITWPVNEYCLTDLKILDGCGCPVCSFIQGTFSKIVKMIKNALLKNHGAVTKIAGYMISMRV